MRLIFVKIVQWNFRFLRNFPPSATNLQMANLFRETLMPVLFYDGDPYHIETSSLIWSVNQLTDFYMTWTSMVKELGPMET